MADDRVHKRSPPEQKIALFRRLFRGREDVYARRFESRRTGKSGYQPACAHEWLPAICEKPRIKCSACPHQRFLPVTDKVLRWHLAGQDDRGEPMVMGAYPMLRDETCWFLALDLDGAAWHEDARALLETCRRFQVPVALERSRSGQAGHLWFFFPEALPARLARRLGSYLLTETMEGHPGLGFASYDRLFPNQDTLPRGGLGNLIALPLQKGARSRGNSVFLDERLEPFDDQWLYLSTVTSSSYLNGLGRARVEALVSRLERSGSELRVRLPSLEDDDGEEGTSWSLPPLGRVELPHRGELPQPVELILANQIDVAKRDLTAGLLNRLIRLAAFQNPEFVRAQAMRLPTYGKPRVIGCAELHGAYLGLPRGCLEETLALFATLKIPVTIRDKRFEGTRLEVKFLGTLRDEQKIAAQAMLSHDQGVLAATTAFGKTVIAAWLIAERGVNTLVLVHRRQLMEQWLDRLTLFLDLRHGEIGRIGGGRRKPNGRLDVALIQSLTCRGRVADLVADYGQVIVDECHHVSARSFQQVVRQFRGRFVMGLSATVTRKDGHHPLIFMQCGPVRYRVDARTQAAARPFTHTVQVRPTNFQLTDCRTTDVAQGHRRIEDGRVVFQEVCRALSGDARRNQLICGDVSSLLSEGRSPLVLTERHDHLDHLAENLATLGKPLFVLRGGMSRRQIREVGERLAAMGESEPRVILATGKFIGEGFDDARLDTLLLTMPISWRGTLAQYVGRLHRLHDQKRDIRVYDYADLNLPMLARMFERRCRGYDAVGYSILVPANAVPGWPSEVSLPVDPGWKLDYSASVRRLVEDGVDAPLARLFVQAVGEMTPDREGVLRARSGTEAFLYRRLQSLSLTAGKFRLNALLPIPFDGRGEMEVDLLCHAARLAIELDGPHHLESHDAYRRDRRKDALLQEHDYFVLRFLAEDVGKQLEMVLDTILRAVTRRESMRPTGEVTKPTH
jgi:superfamily II DNA or RNA helicase/very-short-patch-repair endonuclease